MSEGPVSEAGPVSEPDDVSANPGGQTPSGQTPGGETPGGETPGWQAPRWQVRLKQVGSIATGLVLATIMCFLGVWQFQVYRDSGEAATQARLAQPPLDLLTAAPAGTQGGNAYGRTVLLRGHYDLTKQVLIPEPGQPDTYRVVSAFVQDDGSLVAVVRGVFRGPADQIPAAPEGTIEQTGVFLPSEPTDNEPVATDQISTVRVSVLAQRWSGQLVSGFVTLNEQSAQQQGFTYQSPELPREGGELRNGAYAVQWWVFAAFAVGFGFKMAHDFGAVLRLADDGDDEE